MKRLIKKAALDYTNAKTYTAENDTHWANIAANISNLPYMLQNELTDALMNYTNDTSQYQGEHPLSIISTWKNRPELSEQLDAQQISTLNMLIIPEIESISLVTA